MKFLKRILFAAVIVGELFVENELAATVVSFDSIIAAPVRSPFQPEWHNAGVVNTCAPNNGLPYIYFTIIPVGGIGAIGGPAVFDPLNRNNPFPPPAPRAGRAPQPGETNIYFLENGCQPTTLEAIAYSCANVDNTPNSPITEWYMKMFGILPIDPIGAHVFLTAGWEQRAGGFVATRIIRYQFVNFFQGLVQGLRTLATIPIPGVLPTLNGNALNTLTIRQLNASNVTHIGGLGTALDAIPAITESKAYQDAIRPKLICLYYMLQNADTAAGAAGTTNVQMLQTNILPNYFQNAIRPKLICLYYMLQNADTAAGAAGTTNVQMLQTNILPNYFQNMFRTIATLPVGRVLLYRILIEIRREWWGNRGAMGTDIVTALPPGVVLPNRDLSRSIFIDATDRFFFKYGTPATMGAAGTHAVIAINNVNRRHRVIGINYGHCDTLRWYENEDNASSILFHELLHWYHFLRNTNRYAIETYRTYNNDPNIYRTNSLWLNYWGALGLNEEKLASESRWTSDYSNFDLEEIRTILGAIRIADDSMYTANHYYSNIPNRSPSYLEGDDLSENLFRVCCGLPLTFGYATSSFIEDSRVINKVIAAISGNIVGFNRTLGSYRFVD